MEGADGGVVFFARSPRMRDSVVFLNCGRCSVHARRRTPPSPPAGVSVGEGNEKCSTNVRAQKTIVGSARLFRDCQLEWESNKSSVSSTF